MPDRQGQFSIWLEYSQHLTNCINWRWKEHHTEAAYDCIKDVSFVRQTVCRGDVELCILESKMVSGSTSGFDHLWHRIDPEDLAFRTNQSSHGACWPPGARSK